MFEQIAKIIDNQFGDKFTGQDYDRGWHDSVKRIAIELANYFSSQNHRVFDRQAFLETCSVETDQTESPQQQTWKAVPYNEDPEQADRAAVATIVDSNNNVIADVFSQEAVALIETVPQLKGKLDKSEKKVVYLEGVLGDIEARAKVY